MTEAKIEWVVQFENALGRLVDGGVYDRFNEAQEYLEWCKTNHPHKKYQLIKRTTVTTEEIVK